MLFVINPNDCVHTGYYVERMTLLDNVQYLVLDTDDLTVELVSFSDICDIIKSGVEIHNIQHDYSLRSQMVFADYLGGLSGMVISCCNGLVKYYSSGRLVIAGKNLGLSVGWRLGYGTPQLQISYKKGQLLLEYGTSGHYVKSGVAYIYKVNDYIIVRYLHVFGSGTQYSLSTVLIFDKRGEVVDVIPDTKLPATEVKNNVTSSDAVFTAKYVSMIEKRY